MDVVGKLDSSLYVIEIYVRTLYIPWLKLIEIDVADDIEIYSLTGDLLLQVVLQEFLFSWMKSETWRHLRLPIHSYTHVFSHFEF